jgi:cobyrinic acid a,c-diamide synthase
VQLNSSNWSVGNAWQIIGSTSKPCYKDFNTANLIMASASCDAVRACPALLLASTASGQGKTTLTAALAYYYRRQGYRVCVFKTGPDFLDPMILAAASQAPVPPLDLWMVGAEHCHRILYDAAHQADMILIEGAMGLFDGTPSAADLAEYFNIPVGIILNSRGMGQTFGAIAAGLANYRPGLRCAGVIANLVASERHATMLRAGLPEHIPWLGSLPRLADDLLPRRHLGLVQAAEITDLQQRLQLIADALPEALTTWHQTTDFKPAPPVAPLPPLLAGQKIAVAHDAAFSFLYAENIRILKTLGAEITFFSPLTSTHIDGNALYLPGGYPELYLDELATNHPLRAAVHQHVAAGYPIYAECGGLLYLLDTLYDQHGQSAAMLGLLPGIGRLTQRLAGLGMQRLSLPTGELRGHTFHHSVIETPLTPTRFACRQIDDQPGEAFYQFGSIQASYLHLYFPSAPIAAAHLFIPAH